MNKQVNLRQTDNFLEI